MDRCGVGSICCVCCACVVRIVVVAAVHVTGFIHILLFVLFVVVVVVFIKHVIDQSCMHSGAEEWVVNRCGIHQTYRINYFKREDDEFYSEIVPTNWTGIRDQLLLKFKRLFT